MMGVCDLSLIKKTINQKTIAHISKVKVFLLTLLKALKINVIKIKIGINP